MFVKPLPELTPEEKAMSIYKYYLVPVRGMPAVEEQILRKPLPLDEITQPADITTLLQPSGYTGTDYGCTMLPDGSGYTSTYNILKNVTPEMLGWWYEWVNVPPSNMPAGCGNIKYKVWLPYGHKNHCFRTAPTGETVPCADEALDFGAGDPSGLIFMNSIDPLKYGATQAQLDALNAAGCGYGLKYETFDTPGMHLCLSLIRPYENGLEMIGREWIGYGVLDGTITRIPETPVDYDYLVKVMRHCSVENRRLDDILPAIYEEYHNLPMDTPL